MKTKKKTLRAFLALTAIVSILTLLWGCKRANTPSPQPTISPLTSLLQSPLPPQEGRNGRLLFHSNRTGNYDIYVLDLETGAITPLTNSPQNEVEPAFSPDGTRIAFARARTDPRGQDLYVMNADGSDQHQIAYMEDGFAMTPDWSPDGEQIAFYATKDSHFHLFVVSPDGGDVMELPGSDLNDMMPDWSPDGDRLAFTSDRNGHADLYVMSVDGSNLRWLTNSMPDEWRPRWSPDGRHIVFQANYTGHWEIYIINVETGEIEQLTDGRSESVMPCWDDSGRFIYYAHEEQDGYNLYVIDLELGTSWQLTQSPGVNDRYPVWIPR